MVVLLADTISCDNVGIILPTSHTLLQMPNNHLVW